MPPVKRVLPKVAPGVSLDPTTAVMPNTDLRVFVVETSALKPHPRNSRLHPEVNIQSIARSLAEFGQRTPLVVWRGWVIKGCGTLEALKRMNVPTTQVVRADELTEERAMAYAIADNKTGDLSGFDYQVLSSVLRDLQGAHLDLEVTGFQKFEVEPLMQATWTPPDAEMPAAGAGSGGSTKGFTLHFDNEQWALVQLAISSAKEVGAVEEEARDVDVVMALLDQSVKTIRAWQQQPENHTSSAKKTPPMRKKDGELDGRFFR